MPPRSEASSRSGAAPPEMEKTFDPARYEARWQAWWRDRGFFRAHAPTEKPTFCIMIPPPNVTGRLHMGHALQSTLQDLLTRRRRMQGFEALWLPGTDHAGIATQLMVERQLAREGLDRSSLGRERFLERMWRWTEEHHGNIRRQLDRLGASCDWSRERFTLDEGLSRAVREAFVRLYEEGLVTRGEYMVNWSPALDTAISDLEVETKEVVGRLYYVAYPLTAGEGKVVVATTRPETIVGDTAVAVHPDDERYRDLVGQMVVLPLVGRHLPIVADAAVEPGFGTGAVKVTPFHDPADFEIAQRHGLPRIQVIDRHGRMTAEAGEWLAGLDRFAARERILDRLRGEGLLLRSEEHVHRVGHCQRSGEPIEPLVSTQWFCDVGAMAARALAAEQDGRLRLLPDTWVKTWEHWLENIRPWCISRQLWWGHQIPAWYDEEGNVYVARTREEAEAAAGTASLAQDPDVLDTWFSSALWPFSTLGWPEPTLDLATFYPTDVLVTGFDILFFWVARMVMFGLHFTDREPFHTVHLTGLVRDAEGHKMSKTRGNTVDPLDLVEEFGGDALRFTLAVLDSPGHDIPLDRERIAGYRAFGNKIWNAVRFALSRTGSEKVARELDASGLEAPERWILSRSSRAAGEVNRQLDLLRFDEACQRLYHFFWGELCDWYIELAKPALGGESPRPRVGEVLLTVLERSLRLLHPVMPFLTEELWQRLPGHEAIQPETICLAPYPDRRPEWEDEEVEFAMTTFVDVVTRVRALRSEIGVGPGERLELVLAPAATEAAGLLLEQAELTATLCGLGELRVGEAPPGALRELAGGVPFALASRDRDLAAERRFRLEQEATEVTAQLARLEELLANPQFLAKAPVAVVEKNRQRRDELSRRLAALRLEAAGVTARDGSQK